MTNVKSESLICLQLAVTLNLFCGVLICTDALTVVLHSSHIPNIKWVNNIVLAVFDIIEVPSVFNSCTHAYWRTTMVIANGLWRRDIRKVNKLILWCFEYYIYISHYRSQNIHHANNTTKPALIILWINYINLIHIVDSTSWYISLYSS